MLDALSWNRLDDIALELLRAKIRQTLGECFAEPGAEHDNELPGPRLAWLSGQVEGAMFRVGTRRKRAK